MFRLFNSLLKMVIFEKKYAMNYSNQNLSIKCWAEEDRPREKLLHKGKTSLSDAELIAILLGSGSRNETAVSLAKRILNSAGNNIKALAKLSIEELCQFNGIGPAKAINLIAAIELGRRRGSEASLVLDKITCSKDVFTIMWPLIGDLPHEEFWVLFLNNSNKVLFKQQLSKGGITGTLVDVRLVFKKALALFATSIILCHNHPSGKLIPSMSDKQLTQKIKKAGATIDIAVLDHLILTENAYFSFADESIL